MGFGYEELPETPLPGHRRYVMGVAFPDPMQMPQLVLQREGKKSVIYGYSPQGPHSRFIQFTTGKGKLLGYMKGSLEGMGMKMGDKNTLRVYSAEKEYLGAISGGMTRSHGVVDPSGKWIMALQGRQGGVLRTMKFMYTIIRIKKKKFFHRLKTPTASRQSVVSTTLRDLTGPSFISECLQSAGFRYSCASVGRTPSVPCGRRAGRGG